jgi:hypothetical protein
MKYLTDSEIYKWNDILNEKQLGYNLYPLYSNNNSNVDVKIIFHNNEYNINNIQRSYKEPYIKYDYRFSIYKETFDFFNLILDKIIIDNIETSVFIETIDNNLSIPNLSKKRKIQISNTNVEKKVLTHKIDNNEYVMLDYKFEGLLCDIMGYYSLLKRCIHIFNNHWNVVDNKLVPLFKWNKFDIASDLFNNEIIIDDIYIDSVYNKNICYSVRIINNNNNYIEYSQQFVLRQDEIKNSRNEIISNILE